MKPDKTILFTPKFWPDKENWSHPSDEGIDFDNLNLMLLLAYRQKLRLYYRNWVNVWRTYAYFSKYAFASVPLLWIVTKSWLLAITELAILIAATIIVHKKLDHFNKFRFLIPGLLDSYLVDQFGELLPFEDE